MTGRYITLHVAPVNGCRHCGIPFRACDDPGGLGHAGQYWTPDGVGWHAWTPPTNGQIKGRMIARRASMIIRREERKPRPTPRKEDT